MDGVMNGIRILEVAEHTFVPAASAVLADWGADVVKVEHVTRGDAMRGLMATGHGLTPAGDGLTLVHIVRKANGSVCLLAQEGRDLDVVHACGRHAVHTRSSMGAVVAPVSRNIHAIGRRW